MGYFQCSSDECIFSRALFLQMGFSLTTTPNSVTGPLPVWAVAAPSQAVPITVQIHGKFQSQGDEKLASSRCWSQNLTPGLSDARICVLSLLYYIHTRNPSFKGSVGWRSYVFTVFHLILCL